MPSVLLSRLPRRVQFLGPRLHLISDPSLEVCSGMDILEPACFLPLLLVAVSFRLLTQELASWRLYSRQRAAVAARTARWAAVAKLWLEQRTQAGVQLPLLRLIERFGGRSDSSDGDDMATF